jgi:hypothetical protein
MHQTDGELSRRQIREITDDLYGERAVVEEIDTYRQLIMRIDRDTGVLSRSSFNSQCIWQLKDVMGFENGKDGGNGAQIILSSSPELSPMLTHP